MFYQLSKEIESFLLGKVDFQIDTYLEFVLLGILEKAMQGLRQKQLSLVLEDG